MSGTLHQSGDALIQRLQERNHQEKTPVYALSSLHCYEYHFFPYTNVWSELFCFFTYFCVLDSLSRDTLRTGEWVLSNGCLIQSRSPKNTEASTCVACYILFS